MATRPLPARAPHPVSRARAKAQRARARWYAVSFSHPAEEARYSRMHRAEHAVLRWVDRCYTVKHAAIIANPSPVATVEAL